MTKAVPVSSDPLKKTLECGQSIWYDGLLPRADFERAIREDGLRGATTNPAIFEKAIAESEHDAELLKVLRSQGAPAAYEAIAVRAVREVAGLFHPVYQQSRGLDGYVSLEVSPHLAYDTEGTLKEARDLWKRVSMPNAMIKIPATRQGVPAVRKAISEGINVNVTLIFAVQRHREVMEAYLQGLEDRLAAGLPVSGIASVASFFVSRVDTAVDKLLVSKGAPQTLLGQAAIANSKAAYEKFEKVFGGARFAKLKAKGARPQRPLWASTGTKNPTYSDVLYVEALIGPDTVNTVPPATLAAFCDHGVAASRLKQNWKQARELLVKLREYGIDLTAVTDDLEEQGVKLFCEAYDKILRGLSEKAKG